MTNAFAHCPAPASPAGTDTTFTTFFSSETPSGAVWVKTEAVHNGYKPNCRHHSNLFSDMSPQLS
jgi:hypothetical protein